MTKRAYFILYREETGAQGTVYLFNRHVILNHGMPVIIISDRDSRFRVAFWQTIINQQETKTRMSTAVYT